MPDSTPQPDPRPGAGQGTVDALYAERLLRLQSVWWKRLLDVQRPYRRNLQRMSLGACLDVGCGVGRNLVALGDGSVGVDHNATAVALCRSRGLTAFTPEEFHRVGRLGSFDSLLVAHVLEHLDVDAADALLADYLPYLRAGGRIVVLTPQEVGQRSDLTHVRFVDHEAVRAHAARHGLTVWTTASFPFPRWAGRIFVYNEFVTVLGRT